MSATLSIRVRPPNAPKRSGSHAGIPSGRSNRAFICHSTNVAPAGRHEPPKQSCWASIPCSRGGPRGADAACACARSARGRTSRNWICSTRPGPLQAPRVRRSPPDRASELLQSTLAICSDCDIAETFRWRFAELVMDRPAPPRAWPPDVAADSTAGILADMMRVLRAPTEARKWPMV